MYWCIARANPIQLSRAVYVPLAVYPRTWDPEARVSRNARSVFSSLRLGVELEVWVRTAEHVGVCAGRPSVGASCGRGVPDIPAASGSNLEMRHILGVERGHGADGNHSVMA